MFVCAFRAILDLCDSCICHCYKWKYLKFPGPFGSTKVQICARVSERYVLCLFSFFMRVQIKNKYVTQMCLTTEMCLIFQ